MGCMEWWNKIRDEEEGFNAYKAFALTSNTYLGLHIAPAMSSKTQKKLTFLGSAGMFGERGWSIQERAPTVTREHLDATI